MHDEPFRANRSRILAVNSDHRSFSIFTLGNSQEKPGPRV
jgi:hypothetical protein